MSFYAQTKKDLEDFSKSFITRFNTIFLIFCMLLAADFVYRYQLY